MSLGYDISASRADALAQAANASAPTFINFGSGSIDADLGPLSATPTTSATAARNAAGSGNVEGRSETFGGRNDLLLYFAVGIALLALLKRK